MNSLHPDIRPMAGSDLHDVVRVHLAAFPGFFLSFLGSRFLRLFYGEAVRLGEIALVAHVDGRCMGFAVGSTSSGGFYKRLIQRRVVAFAFAALPAVARRPTIALRVARALGIPSTARKPDGTATLMSLSVDPVAQGTGVGKQLVRAFMAEAKARKARRLDLTTDKFKNDATNHFYRSLGFQVVREIVTPEGRVLNEYERELSAD